MLNHFHSNLVGLLILDAEIKFSDVVELPLVHDGQLEVPDTHVHPDQGDSSHPTQAIDTVPVSHIIITCKQSCGSKYIEFGSGSNTDPQHCLRLNVLATMASCEKSVPGNEMCFCIFNPRVINNFLKLSKTEAYILHFTPPPLPPHPIWRHCRSRNQGGKGEPEYNNFGSAT